MSQSNKMGAHILLGERAHSQNIEVYISQAAELLEQLKHHQKPLFIEQHLEQLAPLNKESC